MSTESPLATDGNAHTKETPVDAIQSNPIANEDGAASQPGPLPLTATPFPQQNAPTVDALHSSAEHSTSHEESLPTAVPVPWRTSGYFGSVEPVQPSSHHSSPLTRSRAVSQSASVSPSVSASDATASGLIQVPDSSWSHHQHQHQIPERNFLPLVPNYPPSDSTANTTSGTSPLLSAQTSTATPSLRSERSYPTDVHPPQLSSPPHLYQPRRQGTAPNQIYNFSAAIASLHASGARTAQQSPAGTPGLFTPGGSLHSVPAAFDSASSHPSPFLHFTHTQVPKETHIADVDVDPISGRKLINHYEIIDELGRGTHGKVKLGRDLETKDTYVAIKIVERFSKRRKLGKLGNSEDKVKKEVAILKKARHPNVVALLEVIDDPSRKKVYIVLEWVEQGEIRWRTKAPKEVAMIEARRYEREKSGQRMGYNQRLVTEDELLLSEAQRRLRRQKRRVARAHQQEQEEATGKPRHWSLEMAGDESDFESDDGFSYISTTTGDSWPAREHRARSQSPGPRDDDGAALTRSMTHPAWVTEPDSISPLDLRRASHSLIPIPDAYDMDDPTFSSSLHEHSSSPPPRVASLTSTRSSQRGSHDDFGHIAGELLNSYLDRELEYVPMMTMQQIRVAFRDTLLGLHYLHYQGIVHRDIKPPNLLASSGGRIKISDFSVSYLGKPVHDGDAGEQISEAEARDLDDEAKELAKTVGTPAFYAPELCSTDHNDAPLPVTKAIDVWALGITLFCMLFARTPFVDTEYVVMRQIADEVIYLPRQRLQPVFAHEKSSAYARAFPSKSSGRRGELDLVYEEIDDELYDLLSRLLIKNPKQRITLEEVRRHPWVLADIPDKLGWLEETDPSKQSEGKKIEISNQELKDAVVPLNIVERMRSGLKKGLEKIGLGTKASNSRLRASSQAQKEGGTPPGSTFGSPMPSEHRRNSLRADEALFAALKASREGGDHPLSRTVTIDSVGNEPEGYFSHPPEPAQNTINSSSLRRPSPPPRAATYASTAGSMRTVTQSDYSGRTGESPPASPGYPTTPTAVTATNPSTHGGMAGGMGHRMIGTFGSRSSQRGSDGRLSERGSIDSFDPHAQPSIAVDQTVVAGQVDLPDALKKWNAQTSLPQSPATSQPGSSATSPELLSTRQAPSAGIGSHGSDSSMASIGWNPWHVHRDDDSLGAVGSRPHSRMAPESSAEDWKRAEDERIRRLIRENQEQTAARAERSPSALSDVAPAVAPAISADCPPSPDDMRFKRDDSRVSSMTSSSNADASYEAGGLASPIHHPPSMMSSSSDLGSAVSASLSNPSIPSAISEASSLDHSAWPPGTEDKSQQWHLQHAQPHPHQERATSDDTLDADRTTALPIRSLADFSDEGYHPDVEIALDDDVDPDDIAAAAAIGSPVEDPADDDLYDDSSDSDGGLQMTRRKSVAKPAAGVAAGGETAPAMPIAAGGAALGDRRNTGLSTRSKKSSRSGSNNTMRKIRTRDSIDE